MQLNSINNFLASYSGQTERPYLSLNQVPAFILELPLSYLILRLNGNKNLLLGAVVLTGTRFINEIFCNFLTDCAIKGVFPSLKSGNSPLKEDNNAPGKKFLAAFVVSNLVEAVTSFFFLKPNEIVFNWKVSFLSKCVYSNARDLLDKYLVRLKEKPLRKELPFEVLTMRSSQDKQKGSTC